MYIYLFNLINPIHTPEKIFCYAAGHNTAMTGQIGRGDRVPLFQYILKIHPPPAKAIRNIPNNLTGKEVLSFSKSMGSEISKKKFLDVFPYFVQHLTSIHFSKSFQKASK